MAGKNSFRDATTNVLTAWGFMETNAPGDLKRAEADDFALEVGKWQFNGTAWVPFTPPPVPPPDPFATGPTSGPWLWLCSVQTDMTTPPSGQIRFNNLDPALAAQAALSTLTDDAFDLAAVFKRLVAGDQLHVQDQNDATRWARYALTVAPADQTGWWLLSFTLVQTNGLTFISGNNKLAVVFAGGAMLTKGFMADLV